MARNTICRVEAAVPQVVRNKDKEVPCLLLPSSLTFGDLVFLKVPADYIIIDRYDFVESVNFSGSAFLSDLADGFCNI